MKKKICVVTSSRAEYGLLKGIIKLISEDKELELCLVATGTHLSREYGYTVSQIENDGFIISEKPDILVSGDTPAAVSKTQGMAFIAFADIFARQKPDMLVILGDRTEMIPVAFAAVNERIPIAHISGGETTEGAVDECVRHSLTKTAYLHFPACEEYRKRIIQLGEAPDRVFNFGDVGVEMVKKAPKPSREELKNKLNFDFNKPYICVIFHPVTLQIENAAEQTENLLSAIDLHKEYNYFILHSNSDAGGHIVMDKIKAYAGANDNCALFTLLDPETYAAVLSYSAALLGNSSSGIVEAPALNVPTINIGDRQKGRLQANSIISCEPEKNAISKAILKLKSEEFRENMKNVVSPYGDGNVSYNIYKCIKEFLNKKIDLKKKFYDL